MREQCLAFAVKSGDEYGTWGGLRKKEVRQVRRLYKRYRENGYDPEKFDFSVYLHATEPVEEAS